VKTEPLEGGSPSRTTSSTQLKDWLQGGACTGVQVDSPAKTSSMTPVRAAEVQPGIEADGALWFFLVDAFEDDRASPPRLYLFGKVKSQVSAKSSGTYESCCLVVEGLERVLHLLLNVQDTDDDAAVQETAREADEEFNSLCREHCPNIRKLRSKFKHRNYAFEKPLPNGYRPFLKVFCDASGERPPHGMFGRTFSHVFGGQTSMLERLMLTRRIWGPSWLRILPGSWTESPAKLSFCAIELRIKENSLFAPKKTAGLAKTS